MKPLSYKYLLFAVSLTIHLCSNDSLAGKRYPVSPRPSVTYESVWAAGDLLTPEESKTEKTLPIHKPAAERTTRERAQSSRTLVLGCGRKHAHSRAVTLDSDPGTNPDLVGDVKQLKQILDESELSETFEIFYSERCCPVTKAFLIHDYLTPDDGQTQAEWEAENEELRSRLSCTLQDGSILVVLNCCHAPQMLVTVYPDLEKHGFLYFPTPPYPEEADARFLDIDLTDKQIANLKQRATRAMRKISVAGGDSKVIDSHFIFFKVGNHSCRPCHPAEQQQLPSHSQIPSEPETISTADACLGLFNFILEGLCCIF